MCHPKSDIGRLQHRYIIFKQYSSVLSVQILAKTPKEAEARSIQLGQYQDIELLQA